MARRTTGDAVCDPPILPRPGWGGRGRRPDARRWPQDTHLVRGPVRTVSEPTIRAWASRPPPWARNRNHAENLPASGRRSPRQQRVARLWREFSAASFACFGPLFRPSASSRWHFLLGSWRCEPISPRKILPPSPALLRNRWHLRTSPPLPPRLPERRSPLRRVASECQSRRSGNQRSARAPPPDY